MFCHRCGREIDDQAIICPHCGVATVNYNGGYGAVEPGVLCSGCSRTVALVLAVLLGGIGVHRFYVGKIGTGILYLFTGGLFGIGYIVDIIRIATGSFTDSGGYTLLNWG